MTFANECVITVTSRDSVDGWGGYNLDKPFLDTTTVSKALPPNRYIFKKENEPTWGVQLIYRYWVPMDYCNQIVKEILPVPDFSKEDGPLSEAHRKIEIIRRDGKKHEDGFVVAGIDGNHLYLRTPKDDKVYGVSTWFSAAIYEILIYDRKQMEFDITNKSKELIQKFKGAK